MIVNHNHKESFKKQCRVLSRIPITSVSKSLKPWLCVQKGAWVIYEVSLILAIESAFGNY